MYHSPVILFLCVLFGTWSLIAFQCFLTEKDHWLHYRQLLARGVVNGFSMLEHGGVMVGDIFIISPLAAYIVSRYDIPYFARGSIICFVLSAIIETVLGKLYVIWGDETPGPHAHDGRTTPAGWVHHVYATFSQWFIFMFYVEILAGKLHPGRIDILVVSTLLIPFWYVSAKKLGGRFPIKQAEERQEHCFVIATWIVTAIIFALRY